MKKIIALSDLHGIGVQQIDTQGADLCLIAGDIAPLNAINQWEMNRQRQWVKNEFCSFISEHSQTEFVFVAGNHDFWGDVFASHDSFWPSNAHYLCNEGIELFGGLKIWGSPIVNPIGCSRRWAFETSDAKQSEVFDLIPEGTHIVLTHTPPYIEGGFIDVPYCATDGNKQPLHLGSVALTDAIRKVKPQFLFCGHIHTGDHSMQKIGNTKCYNVSLLNEQYIASFYPTRVTV